MKYTLRTKLSLSYTLVVLMCVFLVSMLANLFLDRHFTDYVIKSKQRKSREFVSMISQQYKPDGTWDIEAIKNIGMNALEQGMIIKVVDSDDEVVWDAMVHNKGLCQQMLEHMARNMASRYPNWEGGYVENKYPLEYNSEEIGRVEIGYYGPYFFDDVDLAFINTLNQFIIGAGIISLLLSLFIAALMAKRLSMPILKVIDAAQNISKGYYNDKIIGETDIKEISQLIEAINNMAEALGRQEMLRKRLTADMAHELRTPLATLQSHMEAMIDGVWEANTDRLKSCHEEIVRISRLVGDLERLAKYESETLILNKTSFDVSQLIQNIIRNFEMEFVSKGLDIKFYGEKEIIVADKDKISQVIINLLSNALKYTPEGGRVEVRVEDSGDVINIIVKDTGEGISPEDLPYIFERFYRADKSRNRLTGGAGIGLTIAKAIVEAHKGTIQANSRLNEGTKFIVSLPKQ